MTDAEKLTAIRALYEKRCAETVVMESEGEEMFLVDLSIILDDAEWAKDNS
jgi:hypothetical protein